MEIKGHPFGTVVATPPGHPDGTRIDYRPPSGGRAVSKTASEGAFTGVLSKGLVSGKKNEPYAVRGLVAALRTEDRDVHLVDGAHDEDGDTLPEVRRGWSG